MNDYNPSEFYLGQNYPNPFKDKTTIKYCIPHKIKVKITVYNSAGEMIQKLLDEEKKAGTYEIEFSTKDALPAGSQGSAYGGYPISRNRYLEAGIYFYQLKAGNYLFEKEMKVIK